MEGNIAMLSMGASGNDVSHTDHPPPPDRKLTKVLNFYVGHAEDAGLSEKLYSALKALKYLFRFVVQSRVLYLRCVSTHAQGGSG